MSTRIDRKRGRFHVDFETNEINKAISDWQATTGDKVDYYRFDAADTEVDDIYDEAVLTGKAYTLYSDVPVLHVIRVEGGNEDTDAGFYYNDNVHVTASFDMLSRVGMTQIDINTAGYLKDRLVYDQRVFRVTDIAVQGQIQRRDIIVTLEATQVKPDELVNDPSFAQFTL